MPQLALETPLFEVLGAKSAFLKRLENLGIKTIRDLLAHFPARYEDFSKVYSIAELEPGQQATVQGIVEEVRLRRTWRRQMSIVEATIADDTGTTRAVWFNQPYLATTLKVGRTVNFSGKVSISEENEVYLNHPTYEIVRTGAGGASAETTHTARLVPVYPETRGLTSRGLRFIIQSVLKRTQAMKEWIPRATLDALDLPELDHAIRSIHLPDTIEDALAARRRFSFEELFLLQILNVQHKLTLAREHAPALAADLARVKALLAALPFTLTVSQKKSLWEIIQDIEKPRPMNRLLQGDVGSGKTVVAAIAGMIAAENGAQTAFMAPTEILARQHFETMKGLLRAFSGIVTASAGAPTPHSARPAIGLITGADAIVFYEDGIEATLSKADLNKKVEGGAIAIVFGTHALIQKSVQFKNLGLVIVDEQHRFGVRQRADLISKKGAAGTVPHFLSMSATPIPRTLMLTVFGDLDLSLITELPAGRKEVRTKIVPPTERAATYAFIKKEIEAGRQAFVICPRIEPTDEESQEAGAERQKLEMKSVKEEYEKLSTQIFPDLRVAELHGQMKPKEKEEVMRQFKDRQSDLLVATSVVEVGVDVPNATIMMIEGADRFGLAQLYQFRGRVGRGAHQSYCFLLTDSKSATAAARLRAILEANNGFELAEKDLAIRGPGQFFGDVQTGLPDLAMRGLQDPALVKTSREAAVAVFKADPALKASPLLRKKLEEFRARIHQE